LLAAKGIQWLLPHDLAHDAEAFAQDAQVVRTGEITRINARLVPRIRGSQPHPAATLRVRAHGTEVEQVLPLVEAWQPRSGFERPGAEKDLDVGGVEIRPGAQDGIDATGQD